SAKAAGIYTVALKQGFFMDQSKADIIINELTELVTLPQVTR
ncbi:TPA: HAD family hydrolase, partial [Enterococcus faecium]